MRRGRLMMLSLLALALPTAALAQPITFITGNFVSGSITSSFTNPFQVQVIGSITPITLDTSSLTCSGAVCSFSSGMELIPGCTPDGGICGFRDDVGNGRITITATSATITANLSNGLGGFNGFTKFVVSFRGNVLTSGNAEAVITPEPSALEGLLLGTGVLGLAGMARRKLKLGT